MHLYYPLALAGLLVPQCSILAQQSYGFITRLGRDTISIERVTRMPDRLIGDGVQRNPQVIVRHYEAELAPDGAVRRFTIDNTFPGGGARSRLAQHIVIDFAADSVRTTITSEDEGARRTAIATEGMLAMPIFDAIYGPYEQLFAAALRRMGDSIAVVLVSNERMPPGANPSFVKRLAHDSVIFGWLGFPFYGTVEAHERMVSLSGEHTPRRVHVERLNVAPDVASMAAQFAAAERAAGGPANALSMRDTTRGAIGAATLTIDYGRPLMRGRVILGNLVPFDSVWRTGANEATQFRTSAAISLGGIKLDAGTYTLWTMPTRDGATLIVNRQTGQWGTQYSASNDIGRAPFTTALLAEPMERFTIRIEPTGGDTGRLVMEWEWFRWSAEIRLR